MPLSQPPFTNLRRPVQCSFYLIQFNYHCIYYHCIELGNYLFTHRTFATHSWDHILWRHARNYDMIWLTFSKLICQKIHINLPNKVTSWHFLQLLSITSIYRTMWHIYGDNIQSICTWKNINVTHLTSRSFITSVMIGQNIADLTATRHKLNCCYRKASCFCRISDSSHH